MTNALQNKYGLCYSNLITTQKSFASQRLSRKARATYFHTSHVSIKQFISNIILFRPLMSQSWLLTTLETFLLGSKYAQTVSWLHNDSQSREMCEDHTVCSCSLQIVSHNYLLSWQKAREKTHLHLYSPNPMF